MNAARKAASAAAFRPVSKETAAQTFKSLGGLLFMICVYFLVVAGGAPIEDRNPRNFLIGAAAFAWAAVSSMGYGIWLVRKRVSAAADLPHSTRWTLRALRVYCLFLALILLISAGSQLIGFVDDPDASAAGAHSRVGPLILPLAGTRALEIVYASLELVLLGLSFWVSVALGLRRRSVRKLAFGFFIGYAALTFMALGLQFRSGHRFLPGLAAGALAQSLAAVYLWRSVGTRRFFSGA